MAAAARLGHAHASVTTRHYARAAEGQDRVVADGLGQMHDGRTVVSRDPACELHDGDEPD
jgi:hypothetical protein